jgi:UDPglucose 6-dehydrogenase
MLTAQEERTFNIVQIGYGVLGKAYTKAFLEKGNRVTVIESNKEFVQENKSILDIYHISESIAHISNVDFILLMVNTPLHNGRLNMKYLLSTLPTVSKLLETSPDAMVLIRSTVRPMFCTEYKEKLETLLPNQKITVCFQPEFLRAVSSYEDAKNPWLVVLGSNNLEPRLRQRFYDLYSQYITTEKIVELSVEEAELHKMAHNCFNAMKISFFNEFHLLAEKMSVQHNIEIDMNKISKVVVQTCEGILNPKYGTTSGHGYYGSCLPKDSAELAGLEKEYDLKSGLFQAVVHMNDVFTARDPAEILEGDNQMPTHLLAKQAASLNPDPVSRDKTLISSSVGSESAEESLFEHGTGTVSEEIIPGNVNTTIGMNQKTDQVQLLAQIMQKSSLAEYVYSSGPKIKNESISR